MFTFENLQVYHDALDYVDLIYLITKRWPVDERFGLIDQIRRAATSIALTIAEGCSRTKKDFSHFLDLSRGSLFECVAIITIAFRQKYVTEEEYKLIYGKLETLSKKISALKKSIQ